VLTILSSHKLLFLEGSQKNNKVLVSGYNYLRFKDIKGIKIVEGFLRDIVKTEKTLVWPD
jgi:hypothetical protein